MSSQTKPLIVLDKSVLQGVPRGFLANLVDCFEFLLTEALRYELNTYEQVKRQGMSANDVAELNHKIELYFGRAKDECGDSWLLDDAALQWEVKNAQSARTATRCPLSDITLEEISELRWAELLAYDEQLERLVQEACIALSAKVVKQIRIIQDNNPRSFYEWVSGQLAQSELIDDIMEMVTSSVRKYAKRQNLEMPNNFRPDQSWHVFGIGLATQCLAYRETWKPTTKKLANQFLDMVYLAYVAIADGLFSCDKDLLGLAWAMWPEKRPTLYTYDSAKVEIMVYTPKWMS